MIIGSLGMTKNLLYVITSSSYNLLSVAAKTKCQY
jgi:hypothetical protein